MKVFADGREVFNLRTAEGKRQYRNALREMYARQDGKCRICGYGMTWESVTFDHEDGRGMNGSHRDDRIVKDGKPYNGAVHLQCNISKASKRGYGERAV